MLHAPVLRVSIVKPEIRTRKPAHVGFRVRINRLALMTARAADKCDEFPSPHGFAHAKDHLGYERNITFWMKNFGWRIVPFVTPKRAAPMSALGQKQTSELVRSMSALPPKADIG